MEKEDLEKNQRGLLLLIRACPDTKMTGEMRLAANQLASYGLVESGSNSRYEITKKGRELFIKN